MSAAKANQLHELGRFGQSVWFDYISRRLISSGGLKKLIDKDDVRGVTSNPSIFEKAIGSGEGYDEDILRLARGGLDAAQIFDHLAIDDVRAACDVFAPVYLGMGGEDGFVSIEVSPKLAYDTAGTIAEAHRLFAAVDRPNVMIKIPGTRDGIPAIRECLAAGLNINITLMFSMAHYEAVAEAYLLGLEARSERNVTLRNVSSVASFFVSRVDTLVDRLLDERIAAGADARRLNGLKGRLGVANSRLVYERFAQILASARWRRLAGAGAKVQRVLWASTGTKNPAYSDVLYVDELIGANTVNTLPEATLNAFRDHGRALRTVDTGYDDGRRLMRELAEAGIDVSAATEQLQRDGVDLFIKAYEAVVGIVDQRRTALLAADPEKA
jgi:transaldolase